MSATDEPAVPVHAPHSELPPAAAPSSSVEPHAGSDADAEGSADLGGEANGHPTGPSPVPAVDASEGELTLREPSSAPASGESPAPRGVLRNSSDNASTRARSVRFLEDDEPNLPAIDDVPKEAKRRGRAPKAAPAPAENSNQTASSTPTPPPSSVPASASGSAGPKAVSAKPHAPTPEDKGSLARKRIETDARDGPAWAALLEAEVERHADVDEQVALYEKILSSFPRAESIWVKYIELLSSMSEFAQLEKVLVRALKHTVSVDVCASYVAYVRRTNPLPPASVAQADLSAASESAAARRVTEGAYEYVLHCVGGERGAGMLWQEYITLLRERPAHSPWEEAQRLDAVRRAYHQAVIQPTAGVEALWRDYNAFETATSRATMRKLVGDLSAAYMSAREVSKAADALFERIQSLSPPSPLPFPPAWDPLPSQARIDVVADPPVAARDRSLAAAWNALIEWEVSNPLKLDENDAAQKAALVERVEHALHHALAALPFHPEIWHRAATYFFSVGKTPDGWSLLREGFQNNPRSFLLAMAQVQHIERVLLDGQPASLPPPPAQVIPGLSQAGDAAEPTPPPEPTKDMVRNTFDSLIEALTAQLDMRAETHSKAIRALQPEQVANKVEGSDLLPKDDSDDESEMPQALSRRAKEERDRKVAELDRAYVQGTTKLRNDLAVVWIKYMQAIRRTEGLKFMRAIFGRARKSPHVTWRVYEASALTEYHTSKDTRVATNVFELACKIFASPAILALTPGEPSVAGSGAGAVPSLGGAAAMQAAQDAAAALAIRYLKFLLSINDENNARALFERIVSSPLSPELTRPLWDQWREFTHQYGDAAAIGSLDSRFLAMYPSVSPLEALSEAVVWADDAPIHHRDLGYLTSQEEEEQQRAAPAAPVQAPPAGTGTIEPVFTPRARSDSPAPSSIPFKRAGEEMGMGPKRPKLGGPPPAMRERERERERERALGQAQEAVNLPPSVWELVSKLVPAATYDGPHIAPDLLLRELRSAAMPSLPTQGYQSPLPPPAFGDAPLAPSRPPWLRASVGRPRKY